MVEVAVAVGVIGRGEMVGEADGDGIGVSVGGTIGVAGKFAGVR
jgi:hypothetical protein